MTERHKEQGFASVLRESMENRKCKPSRLRDAIGASGVCVDQWLAARQRPSVELFGNLLQVFRPSGDELESLVSSWLIGRGDKMFRDYTSNEIGNEENRGSGNLSQASVGRALKVSRQRVNQIIVREGMPRYKLGQEDLLKINKKIKKKDKGLKRSPD